MTNTTYLKSAPALIAAMALSKTGDGRHGGAAYGERGRERGNGERPGEETRSFEEVLRDKAEFSALRQTQVPELHALLAMVRQSGEGIRSRARLRQEGKIEQTPCVAGLPLATATRLLAEAGLRLARVHHKRSADIPAGSVILQMPGPGATAMRHLGVALVVSKGSA